jgi:hypothetical protein
LEDDPKYYDFFKASPPFISRVLKDANLTGGIKLATWSRAK